MDVTYHWYDYLLYTFLKTVCNQPQSILQYFARLNINYGVLWRVERLG